LEKIFYRKEVFIMARVTNAQIFELLQGLDNKVTSLEERMNKLEKNRNVPPKGGKGSSKTTTKVEETEVEETEVESWTEKKESFKKTHTLVATAKENRQKVYDAMKKKGIEFNRKDYEKIAKKLGVLGSKGQVVATWKENK